MFFETQEDSIVAQLIASYPSGIDIIAIPEKISEVKSPFSKPRITVAFTESDFMKAKSTYEISQIETQYYDIELEARNLRGTGGIYDIAQKVQYSLLGFMPTNCEKMWAVKLERHGYREGIWTYVLRMATQTIICEIVPTETGPAISSMTAQEPT